MFLTPREYFRLHGSQPRKRFGQHFLVQPATAENIVRSAKLEETDVVVEIGPGLGALTQFILPRVKRLHLVELDRDLAAYLEAHLVSASGSVQVHQQDVLQFDFLALSRTVGSPLVLLGNLPYSISSPLLFQLLGVAPAVKRAVFMLQKEVAERLLAVPGTKNYGILSVLLTVYADVARLFPVNPRQFYPPPEVESLVVRLEFLEQPLMDDESFRFLRRIVNSAFQQRRKTLRNSLRALLQHLSAEPEQVFKTARIDPMRRPETLSLDEFIRLAEALEMGSRAAV